MGNGGAAGLRVGDDADGSQPEVPGVPAPVPADEHADYVARWEQVEGLCGADFEQVFAHLRTAFGNGRNPIINEIRRLSLAAGGAKAFLDQRLLPMATLYGGMRGHGGAPAVLNAPALRHVRYLERLSHSDWLPSALLWAYQRPGDATAIADFVANLDRFAHG